MMFVALGIIGIVFIVKETIKAIKNRNYDNSKLYTKRLKHHNTSIC